MDKLTYIKDLLYLFSVPNESKSEKIEKLKKDSIRELRKVEKKWILSF